VLSLELLQLVDAYAGLWSFRDQLNVSEPTGQRWELALERLREGHGVVFRQVALSVGPEGLRASVGTRWDDLAGTRERALDEIGRAERVVAALIEESNDFAALVASRPTIYALLYDYGTGAVLIAELRDGQLQWGPGVQPADDARGTQ
jgi:hypothetical protein